MRDPRAERLGLQHARHRARPGHDDRGSKEDLVPAEVIEGVGLLRPQGPGAGQLTLWYDPSRLPELPKGLRRRERQPGQLRLAMVMDEVGCLSQDRVKEIRTFVQAHRLGEWRNRKAP